MNRVRFDPNNALTRDGGSRAEINFADADASNGPTDGPEPVGAIAARILAGLATRQRDALARLARAHQHHPLLHRREEQP